ncbi:3-methyl-2-oxobutanoate hydroxymethyltransferase [Sinobacterium caligoides]|uniref:3-methyl-2-oxobutanoate hydroxymethyltransferase n=1 Tax=Sinobacterium caligoides TaxID=933926 RepID=A0A3N2DFQ5_9GAMM|nr:3-methyl-2-oxobutanoate hydroxymethyltransferase [Sinobacterium caligoides]ROR98635.1 3-methyl-2-oxobutanoate hydroxymethyltransferase [Sinobacterium caligoides]
MSSTTIQRSTTVQTLSALKQEKKKFSCLTSYDATFAHIISEAGIESILVGDSLGNVLQGHDTTLPVTVEDLAYHTAAVARGNEHALIITDLPFMGYATPEQAMDNATQVMRAGAHVVKVEGGTWLCPTIAMLTERGIPVCAHLGLTPQSVNTLGGFKVQGRSPEQAQAIIADAKAIEAAGAGILVLECVPSELAKTITEQLTIPVIGIGAGSDTDGQVLVLHDMLGLNPRPAKFVKNFMAASGGSIQDAIALYGEEVKSGAFPGPEHGFK